MGREAVASDSDFESPDDERDDNTSRETHRMTEEEEEEVYGGLAAEELDEEKLFPGDTIEYFSMAFVFGDPRGHRVAKVLKVAHREREYPLRLDSQEMLPSTLMIKRLLNRRGEELEPGAAVWRKIRTFGLVDGVSKGKTRADLLNEGLKTALDGAFQSVYKPLSSSSKPDNQAAERGPLGASKKPRSIESALIGGPKKPKTRESEHQQTSKKDKSTGKNGLCITSFFNKVPKGSLEAVVTAKSFSSSSKSSSSKTTLPTKSSSSRSDKSEKCHSAHSSSSSKALGKRSRVELTPSPSSHKHKDREHTLSSPGKHKHKGDKSHRHEHSPGKRDKKVDLNKFVNRIDDLEKQKQDPRNLLNDYLAIEEKKKAAIEEFKMSKKVNQEVREEARSTHSNRSSGGGGSASIGGSNRMRASGGASERQRKDKLPTRMRSLHNFFPGQARPHPDAEKRTAEKASGALKLNFMMNTENNDAFPRPSRAEDTSKSHFRDSKEARSRDAGKSPKKKGLAPAQIRMGTWINTGKQ